MVVAFASPSGSTYPSPLASYMAAAGLTQRELQRVTGLPVQTISSAYHGRPGSLETYVTIAKKLDVPLAVIAPEKAALLDGLALH